MKLIATILAVINFFVVCPSAGHSGEMRNELDVVAFLVGFRDANIFGEGGSISVHPGLAADAGIESVLRKLGPGVYQASLANKAGTFTFAFSKVGNCRYEERWTRSERGGNLVQGSQRWGIYYHQRLEVLDNQASNAGSIEPDRSYDFSDSNIDIQNGEFNPHSWSINIKSKNGRPVFCMGICTPETSFEDLGPPSPEGDKEEKFELLDLVLREYRVKHCLK